MGVSKETFEKQEMFRTIIRAHLSIVKAIQVKHNIKKPYVYVDAFAGCGEYRSQKWGELIIGSPLIFLQEAERLKIPYRAYAIEEDKELASILSKVSPKYGKLKVICGDNKRELLSIDVRHGDFGMLYADPKGNCPNLPILNEIFQYKCFNKMDILIYASATGIKRAHSAKCSKCPIYTGDIYDCYKSLKEYFSVREVRTAWYWTFILGCNNKILLDKFKSYGFIDGDAARNYIEKIFALQSNIDRDGRAFENRNPHYKSHNFHSPYETYEEYLKHPSFLETKRKREIIAGGICELCKEQKCTEPHHLIYPPWGAFDTIDNFVMVCHRCHCRIHGENT